MSKKQNILTDLINGKVVNMMDDLQRYGTSCRSRISELRREGYDIEGRIVDQESGALEYFIPEAVSARKEIEIDYPFTWERYDNMHTVYKSQDDFYYLHEIGSVKALKMLRDGYTLIPF